MLSNIVSSTINGVYCVEERRVTTRGEGGAMGEGFTLRKCLNINSQFSDYLSWLLFDLQCSLIE